MSQVQDNGLVCTPEGLQEGCASCYSDSDMLAAIALILCRINKGPQGNCTPEKLMEDAACFTCESKKEQLIAITSVLGNYATQIEAVPEFNGLFEDLGCLRCAKPAYIRAIIVREFCYWVNHLPNRAL